jgi:hypothetical protein
MVEAVDEVHRCVWWVMEIGQGRRDARYRPGEPLLLPSWSSAHRVGEREARLDRTQESSSPSIRIAAREAGALLIRLLDAPVAKFFYGGQECGCGVVEVVE